MAVQSAATADLAEDLRAALRTLVRTVTVVTARHGGRCFAMAATAVSEVSLDPPSMLVCVNRSSNLYAAIEAGCELALNILGSEHEAISRACGGGMRNDDRFTIGAWDHSRLDRPPVLADARAVVLLDPVAHLDHGSHRIIVGNVRSVLLPARQAPLAYCDGRYVGIADRLEATM